MLAITRSRVMTYFGFPLGTTRKPNNTDDTGTDVGLGCVVFRASAKGEVEGSEGEEEGPRVDSSPVLRSRAHARYFSLN
jgi:hypothetical protein